MFSFLCAAFAALLASRAPQTFGLPVQPSDDVNVLADAQERLPNGIVHAEGHALLTSRDLRIGADTIDFEPETANGPEIRARGNVILKRGDDVFRCVGLRLELETGRGEFQLR